MNWPWNKPSGPDKHEETICNLIRHVPLTTVFVKILCPNSGAVSSVSTTCLMGVRVLDPKTGSMVTVNRKVCTYPGALYVVDFKYPLVRSIAAYPITEEEDV